MNAISLVRARRAALSSNFDIASEFKVIEESCVPTYLHGNIVVASIAWWRLFSARALYRELSAEGPVLDFGSSTGELYHLLATGRRPVDYHFIEQNEILAGALSKFIGGASRCELDELPAGKFACVFALDSLEHTDDTGAVIDQLIQSLKPDNGVLILSGPTETWLYRLGRRLAGYSGYAHEKTIYDVEKAAHERCRRIALRCVPISVGSLFRVTAWRPS